DRQLDTVAVAEVRRVAGGGPETQRGAHMSALSSRARRQGDEWVLDGRKVFIALVEHTQLIFLLMQADEGPTLFLLDRQEVGAGLEVQREAMIVNRMTTSLFIDGLRVHDSARVGAPGEGLKVLMGGFAPRRIFAAAEAIGNARFLLDISLEHAKTRRTFGRAIGENQGVQYPLAQCYSKVEAADLMRW